MERNNKMGRYGVTYLDVAHAATTLQEKGVNPTVDRVRGLLGTGSKSTIVPYLKEWKTKQNPNEKSNTKETSTATSSKNVFQLKELFHCLFDLSHEFIERYQALEEENQALKNKLVLLIEKLNQSENEKLFLMQQKTTIQNELKKLKEI